MASILFLTSLAGLLAGLQTLQNVEEHQRRLMVATRVGQAEMERALLLPLCGIPIPSAPDDPCLRTATRIYTVDGVVRLGAKTTQVASDLTVERTVIEPGTTGAPEGLRRIDIVVRWTEPNGLHDVEFLTYRP